jgi:hypothetical protein
LVEWWFRAALEVLEGSPVSEVAVRYGREAPPNPIRVSFLALSTRSSAPNVEQLPKPHIPLGNNATVDNRGQVMGSVSSRNRRTRLGWQRAFQLTTMREFRFSSTNLVASTDDKAARFEQS